MLTHSYIRKQYDSLIKYGLSEDNAVKHIYDHRNDIPNDIVVRYSKFSNDFIEDNIEEFYLNLEDDITEIAYSYFISHPLPSNLIIMLFDDFLSKKGLDYIKSNKKYDGSPLHLWARSYQNLKYKIDEEYKNKISGIICRSLILFDLDEKDSFGKTAYDWIKEMKYEFITKEDYENEKNDSLTVDVQTKDLTYNQLDNIEELIKTHDKNEVLSAVGGFIGNNLSNKYICYEIFNNDFIMSHPYLFELNENDDLNIVLLSYLRGHCSGATLLLRNKIINNIKEKAIQFNQKIYNDFVEL